MKGKLIKIWAYGAHAMFWAEYTANWLGSPRFNLALRLYICIYKVLLRILQWPLIFSKYIELDSVFAPFGIDAQYYLAAMKFILLAHTGITIPEENIVLSWERCLFQITWIWISWFVMT